MAENTVCSARTTDTWKAGPFEKESNVFPNPGRGRGTSTSNGKWCYKDQKYPQKTVWGISN